MTHKTQPVETPDQIHLPFALPLVQNKKAKKKCCKKYKKGKRCKNCPGR